MKDEEITSPYQRPTGYIDPRLLEFTKAAMQGLCANYGMNLDPEPSIGAKAVLIAKLTLQELYK